MAPARKRAARLRTAEQETSRWALSATVASTTITTSGAGTADVTLGKPTRVARPAATIGETSHGTPVKSGTCAKKDRDRQSGHEADHHAAGDDPHEPGRSREAGHDLQHPSRSPSTPSQPSPPRPAGSCSSGCTNRTDRTAEPSAVTSTRPSHQPRSVGQLPLELRRAHGWEQGSDQRC